MTHRTNACIRLPHARPLTASSQIVSSQGLSGLSLIKYVQSSPTLMRLLKPVAKPYANSTGHRQMGLRYDDLMIEESPRVQKAISRLPEKEAYDRAFRLRKASQLSVLHRELPKEQWLPAKEVSFEQLGVLWRQIGTIGIWREHSAFREGAKSKGKTVVPLRRAGSDIWWSSVSNAIESANTVGIGRIKAGMKC